MVTRYGRVNLLNPNGPEQEFELAKSHISLGRATTNDIVLSDVKVSRNHALIECTEHSVRLIDLGSSNGTLLNDQQINHATLVPGDIVTLGNQRLQYMVDDPREDVGVTAIDTESQLERTLDNEVLPVVLNDTRSPRLVVFSGDRTWSIDLEKLERVTIGRDESCQIYLDVEKISRRHAEVHREGSAFVLQDLGSTNGTWIRGESIDKHRLQDGEVFNISSAQVLFKEGFQEEALTLVEGDVNLSSRRVVIFVPGLMGSELWLGNERLWPNVKTLFSNPEIFALPSEVPLEPRDIVNEMVIVPNLIKQDQYNRLGDYLVDELNYRRGRDFFEFPYDWRQDVRLSAAQLGAFVEGLDADRPVVLIGHSLGTMVIRYYVECLGGDSHVERILLMGGPHRGAVKGLMSFLVAPHVVPFGIMGERLRKILLTFPSCYQVLPDYAVGTDQNGLPLNFLDDGSWLDSRFLPLLEQGRQFRRELKSQSSTPSVSIFGYGIKTICNVNVRRNTEGEIEQVNFLSDTIGDGSVLEQSAFLQGSEIHPVHQHHGALYVDNDVKMRMKIELLRPY